MMRRMFAATLVSLVLLLFVYTMALIEDRYTRDAVVYAESLEFDETVYLDDCGNLWVTDWNHDVDPGERVTLVMSCGGTHSYIDDDVIVKVKRRK